MPKIRIQFTEEFSKSPQFCSSDSCSTCYAITSKYGINSKEKCYRKTTIYLHHLPHQKPQVIEAAYLLGLSRDTLLYPMKKYGLDNRGHLPNYNKASVKYSQPYL